MCEEICQGCEGSGSVTIQLRLNNMQRPIYVIETCPVCLGAKVTSVGATDDYWKELESGRGQ